MTILRECYIIDNAKKYLEKIRKNLEEITMFEKFADLLVEELQIDRDDITMEAELSNDLGINSIELADLVMLCEEKFDIEINDEDIRKFTTVGDVVAYLETL